MCGLAGIFYFQPNLPNSFQNHQAVLDALHHRGPDYNRHQKYSGADLYHSRLSILDLSENSHQPFENAEKTHALIFNGELFNYQTIRSKEDNIQTTGDVEVLFNSLKNKKKKH